MNTREEALINGIAELVQARIKKLEKNQQELDAIKQRVSDEVAEAARVGCTIVAGKFHQPVGEQIDGSVLDLSAFTPKPPEPPRKFDAKRTLAGK